MSRYTEIEEEEVFQCKVFRDHPEWDRHEKWFMMPSSLLRELYIVTYDYSTPDHLAWIEQQHPGCVFVY